MMGCVAASLVNASSAVLYCFVAVRGGLSVTFSFSYSTSPNCLGELMLNRVPAISYIFSSMAPRSAVSWREYSFSASTSMRTPSFSMSISTSTSGSSTSRYRRSKPASFSFDTSRGYICHKAAACAALSAGSKPSVAEQMKSSVCRISASMR